MQHQENVSDAQADELIKALTAVLKHRTNFLVLLDMEGMALAAGSGRMGLVEFIVQCMLSDESTAQLFINVVLNYMLNKLNVEGCESCPSHEYCKDHKAVETKACGDEALAMSLKKMLEQMRVAKN